MKRIKHVSLKVVCLSLLAISITNCLGDDLDIDLDSCSFYSYIYVSTSCECLDKNESNCSTDYYQLDEKEFNRIKQLFDKTEVKCIEITGVDFSGKSFKGLAQMPFVDYCHKWF